VTLDLLRFQYKSEDYRSHAAGQTGIPIWSKEGVWSRPNDNFRACCFQAPQKWAFRAHETTLYPKGSICDRTRDRRPEASARHHSKKVYLAAERDTIYVGFRNGSGRKRLLRELAPPPVRVLFRVFLKVSVSRAWDDRFRGPETPRDQSEYLK
jgi:hypothetical protein